MNRKLLASAICVGLLVAGSAYAQDNQGSAQSSQNQSSQNQNKKDQSNNTPANSEQNAQNVESVTVSGSLLKRPEYQTTSPVQTIDIKTKLNTGSFSTANLLQQSAVASGSTQINNQFSGFLVNGGTGVQPIDLRGLGANRTLVLVDGQRPGPSGTRGAVGAFDLNVVPRVILGRVEIVKDGSSSIYGSDAIAGVVNLITKKRIEGVQVKASVGVPQHGGGTQATASVGTGWNFSSGHVMLAAQVQEQFPLAYKDRDFFKCSRDVVFGKNGQRIDRTDRSAIQGTPLAGCDNLYADTIIDFYNSRIRYVPSKDGSTVGPFKGFHPRPNPTPRYDDGNPNGAYYEDVLNYPFYNDSWALNKNRNTSFYASSGFNFGNVNWDTQFLYNHRETRTRGFRQFFPVIFGPANADGDNAYEPILPYPSNNKVDVDYGYLETKLSGLFTSTDTWSWEINGNYSRSYGTFGHVGIDARKSGDLTYDVNELSTPPLNYFDPGLLNGQRMNDLVNAVGLTTQGSTTFEQTDFNGLFSGDLFDLPAGSVSSAFGLEFRQTKIDNEPDPNNSAGYEWGYASANVTKGEDNVREGFAELGVPLLKGLPGVESLALDLSGRIFKYNSVGNWDHVWKAGLNWQITPTWRIRGTIGTSYRAPQLYELYLGNEKGFQGQLAVDPCINYQDSTNQNIIAHCAAAGIPADYGGNGASAETFRQGGKGVLQPETSRAKSLGFVWTPTFANMNLAVDYFDYDIQGEIDTLNAGAIVSSCYSRPVYPNRFCDLFHRNGADDPANPFRITDIHRKFININKERTRGYDLQMNYSDDFAFGKLSADMQVTYTIEDTQQLFSSAAASGFNAVDFVGDIGRPATVGNADFSLERGEWTYTYGLFYVSSTSAKRFADPVFSYFGYDGAVRDIKAGWQLRHNVSVAYDHDKWGVVLGVRNLFDKAPDRISSGVGYSRIGNVSRAASQYDYFGRTFFLRTHYDF